MDVKRTAALERGGGVEVVEEAPPFWGWLVAGNGVAAASLLTLLSVCAAVLVYRAVTGQRRGKGDGASGTEGSRRSGGEKEEERSLESTEGSDDGVSEDFESDSSEAIIPSTSNHAPMPSDLLEENLREINPENLREPTVTRTTVSINDAMREARGPVHVETHQKTVKGHVKCDAEESMVVTPNSFDYEGKPSENTQDNGHGAEEYEQELHGDSDEPSETESAQETMETKNITVRTSQSVEDLLDNTLLAQDVVNKSGKEELPTHVSSNPTSFPEVDHKSTKMNEVVVTKKGCEMKTGDTLSQASEIDCNYDKRSDLLNSHLGLRKVEGMEDPVRHEFDNSNISDFRVNPGIVVERLETLCYLDTNCDGIPTRQQPSYLGFTSPCVPGESVGQVQLPEVNREKKEVNVGTPMELRNDKNEINIMEAIMDSNEWLGTGPPDTKDLPWLTQSKSNTSFGLKSSSSAESNPGLGLSTETSQPNSVPTNASYRITGEDNQSHQDLQSLTAPTEEATIADNEEDLLSRKVAAVSPMPQLVPVTFRVHYITHSANQLLAVTGNQAELGAWEDFVPLGRAEGGFWTGTVGLHAECQLEWKFVLVDDGKIRRWEECGNRRLVVTDQKEEIYLDKCWGYM